MPEANPDDAAALAVVGGGDGAVQAEQQPAAQNNTVWTMLKGLFMRMMIIYFVSSLLRSWRGPQGMLTSNGTVKGADGQSGSGGQVSVRPPGNNIFHRGAELDVYIYLSEADKFDEFHDPDKLFWVHRGFIYGDWQSGPQRDGSFTKSRQVPCSETVRNNGSLYIHIYVVEHDNSPDPQSQYYVKRRTMYHSRRLNRFKKKRYQRTQNLLTGKTEQKAEDIEKAETIRQEILSHWHPNLTLNIIDDHTPWTRGSLPPPLDEYVRFDPVSGDYYPIFFFNDYWNLGSEYQPINETVELLNLTVTISPMSLFKWQLYASQTMRNKWTQMFGSDMMEESDDDQDSLKQAILETNPYLLGLTIAVSLLHTVFEFLAFKNDIQFWRSRKSLEGLSVRSVVFNLFSSGVVLLYILDNETNFVVRISVGIGLLIEMWKIPKVLDVKIDREDKLFGVIPKIRFADKGSYVESSTKEYDQLAFKYLSWLLFPLLAAYVVYSLIYNEHRGWYSFVLSMLYGFLLTFGFIMMTPQLFINYKLKSVAHLPWRMLTYKFLNTFIDDIFAFVIRMPTMYRIGCFRDDIVFVIYVYQRWIYRVDPTRVNEFGTSAEMHEEADRAATQGAIDGQERPAVMPSADGDLANGDVTLDQGNKSGSAASLESLEANQEESLSSDDGAGSGSSGSPSEELIDAGEDTPNDTVRKRNRRKKSPRNQDTSGQSGPGNIKKSN